ncbi:MAG: hypothetical protein GXO76_01745, partial [Calditrichaeota bacterium]|nr:hypothetical protein [Calditrichota bacterium]
MKGFPIDMRILGILFLFTAALLTSCAPKNPMERIQLLEKEGKFKKAEKLIDKTLRKQGTSLPDSVRKALLWQKDWMHRVRIDYRYTEKDILDQLQKRVANFKKD